MSDATFFIQKQPGTRPAIVAYHFLHVFVVFSSSTNHHLFFGTKLGMTVIIIIIIIH